MSVILCKFKSLEFFNANKLFWLLLTSCGFFIRVKDLGLYDFSSDDYWHLYVANQENFIEVLKKNFQIEIHPPLSVILWHYALKISDNQMWLRSLSIVFGLALIPSSYLLGRLYVSKFSGYLCAYIVTFGYIFVTQSTVIRAYIFMMFFLVWMAIFVHRYFKKPKIKYLWLYFIFSFCALELNHYSCFIIFFLSINLLFYCYKEKNYEHFKIVILWSLLLCLIMAVYFVILLNYNNQIESLEGFYTNLPFFKKLVFQFFYFIFSADNLFFSNYFEVIDLFNTLYLFCFFYVVAQLIKEKKWHLFNLVIMPLILSIFLASFDIILHGNLPRRSLFLVISQLLIISILIDDFLKYISLKLGHFKYNYSRCLFASTIFIKYLTIISLCLVPLYSYAINSYSREYNRIAEEFFKSKYREALNLNLVDQLADKSNIVIFHRSSIWRNLYHHKNSDFKKISNHVTLEKSGDNEIFWVDVTKAAFLKQNYYGFFSDIKKYLLANNQFSHKKNYIIIENCFKSSTCGFNYIIISHHVCNIFKNKEDFIANKIVRNVYRFDFYDENVFSYYVDKFPIK